MIKARPDTFIARFIRSLLPSAMSALLCVCFGLFMVGTCLLVQSISIGTSLPGLFDGEWAAAYTNHIVQPLVSFFSSVTAANVLTLILWGLAGLVVYALVIYGALFYKQLRAARRNIQITDRVIPHPGLHAFAAATTWRLGVVCFGLVVLIFAGQNILRTLAQLALPAVEGGILTADTLLELFWLTIKVILLAHIGVVIARLLAMKSRLF